MLIAFLEIPEHLAIRLQLSVLFSPCSHYHCRHFAFQWTAQLKAETLLAAGDMLVVFPVPGSWGSGFPIAENRGRMEIGTDPGQWQPEVFHCVACSLLMLSIAVVIHFYCFCTHLPIKWGERISRWGGGKVGKGGKTVERGWENIFPFNFSLHSVCVGTSAGNECIFNANYFLNYIFTLTGAPFVPPSSISFSRPFMPPSQGPGAY